MSREATNSSEGNRKGVGQSGITRTGWKLEMVVERLCSDPSLGPKTWSCATGICESVLCVFASLIQRCLLALFSFWDRYPHRSRGGSDSLPRPVRLLARQPLPMPSPCETFRLS